VGSLDDKKAGVGDEPSGTDDALRKEFGRRLKRSQGAFANWRERAKLFFQTYHKGPWTEEDSLALKAEGRIATYFNYSTAVINTVVGMDMADRKEGSFQGVDGDLYDETVGEWFTKLVRFLYQHAHGHRHESQAQMDQLLSGYGWIEVFFDDSRFPFRIKSSHVDCERMYIDPDYKDDNCADARFVICEVKMAREDAIARWPNREDELQSLAGGSQSGSPYPKRAVANNYAGPSTPGLDDSEDEIRVYDYQYRKRERWVAFKDPQDGKRKELSKADFSEWKRTFFAQFQQAQQAQAGMMGGPMMGMGGGPTGQQGGPMGGGGMMPQGPMMGGGGGMPSPQSMMPPPEPPKVEAVEFPRELYYRAFLAGGMGDGTIVLEQPKRIREDSFTYLCATGFRGKDFENEKTQHFGLMELIYEPQMWSAKVLSLIIEMLARNSKGGGFAESGAVANPATFPVEVSKVGSWVMLNDDAIKEGRIKERQAMQWPSAAERMMDLAVQAIPNLTAVTPSLMGTLQQERSNVLISNLQQQSQVVLNPLFDPMSQLRVNIHGLYAKLAQTYLADEDINRILGNARVEGLTYQVGPPDPTTGKPSEVPVMVPDPSSPEGQRPITAADILRDADILEFHVVVDLGTASTTSKQAIWALLSQHGVLDTMAAAGVPMEKFAPFMVRNLPGIPAETAKRLADDIEGQMKQQEFSGLMEAVQKLPPDQQQQLAQMLQPPAPAPAEAQPAAS